MNRYVGERGTMSAETKWQGTQRDGFPYRTFSPGPWRAEKGADGEGDRWIVIVGGPIQFLVATVENGQPGDSLETEAATAALIAAAPAMYEALEAAHQFIRNGIELGYIRMPDPDTPDSAHETPEKVRSALALARGEG